MPISSPRCRTASPRDPTDAAAVLLQHGILLLADNIYPSVATLIAGGPVRGSWWAHPKSHAIFGAATALGRDPDTIAIPLVAGKITFVHRRLWAALLTVATARARWQTAGLSSAGRALLKRVEAAGAVEASGPAVRALERRLLVMSREVHTERGAHAKILETWTRWASRERVAPLENVAEAKQIIERAAATLGARAALPWK